MAAGDGESTEQVARIMHEVWRARETLRPGYDGHVTGSGPSSPAKKGRSPPETTDDAPSKRARGDAPCGKSESPKTLLVFVHDVSASMKGPKHSEACRAVRQEIIDGPDEHRYLIVTFNHDVQCNAWDPMTRSAALDVLAEVEAREPDGATALFMGVNYAAVLVDRILRTYPHEYDAKQTVIKILTDGADTCSMFDLRTDARDAIARCRQRGVIVALLQAGTDSAAADALGIQQDLVLHWKDDVLHLTSALSASRLATLNYLDQTVSIHNSGMAPNFRFTDEQRMLSMSDASARRQDETRCCSAPWTTEAPME